MIVTDLFESQQQCPECGGVAFSNLVLAEKKDACYHKVKASAKVWPSAYASGRLVQCRKKGAANWGNKSESVNENQELYGLRVGDTVRATVNGKTVQGDVIDIFPDSMEVELLLRGANAGRTITVDVRDTEAMNEQGVAERLELAAEFNLIERIIQDLAQRNSVDAEVIWEDLESLSNDELYVFAVTTPVMEDWQKANKKDRTDGMSRKAVAAYRRENPGSKLKTAVTTKPSKLKRGSKASKRRSSYCSRSRGQMKMHSISCAKTPDKAICKARRRWNCESIVPTTGALTEMDKSAPQPGRDGKVSHSTYGSRDKQSNAGGKEHTAKAVTAKQASKDALNILKKQGVAEAINPDITNPAFSHKQQIGDYLYVARYWSKGLKITAYDGAKKIGRADLMYQSAPFDDFADPKTTPKRIWLESEWTHVDPKYQRQGIMSNMYAYAKMLGNSVKPSELRSPEAKAAWSSWRQSGDAKHLTSNEGVAEGYQLDEGAMETISTLVKKLPGIGKYYQIAQQYKPQLVQILKTSKSGKEVKQKMEALLAQTSTPVAEAGWMKQLGGLAVGGGSILSTMWMNAMGMIDGVLAHAAAGEVGGAVASGSILGLIPVTLMLFAAMLLFKGSKQSSDEKAQAFQAQRGQQGVAEGGYGHRNPDLMSPGDYDRYQQDQMDHNKRDFKRREHEAEWEQEKAYSEKLAARDAGTWYIRINGRLLKDRQGQPYTFQGKAAANRAAVTMMAKPFNAGKQFTLTTTAADRA